MSSRRFAARTYNSRLANRLEHPMADGPRIVRCAIYTRKSADEAADSQFSSLEAQRELCERYIASQAGAGWAALPERYDDGGYSGGTLARPALARLRDHIAQDTVDLVVVYKIDRLSRSLRDFTSLVEELDRARVGFVSITQAFDTSTSMGRLTLNVLLSFAQFERELTGERLRDWFAGARRRGLWTNCRPYGYEVQELRLVVREDEAEVIRHAHHRYPALLSARVLAVELNGRGWRNVAGRPWSKRTVQGLLQNPLYRGGLPHRGTAVPGTHEPIVTLRTWQRTQTAIAESARRRGSTKRRTVAGLLRGLLFDREGHALIHVWLERRGVLYRYYVPRIRRYGAGTEAAERFRATDLEDAVVAAVGRLTGDEDFTKWSTARRRHLVERLVERVVAGPETVAVLLHTGLTLTIGSPGRLPGQVRRRRGPPDWIEPARRMVEAGSTLADAARHLAVPLTVFYRAYERYGRADEKKPDLSSVVRGRVAPYGGRLFPEQVSQT